MALKNFLFALDDLANAFTSRRIRPQDGLKHSFEEADQWSGNFIVLIVRTSPFPAQGTHPQQTKTQFQQHAVGVAAALEVTAAPNFQNLLPRQHEPASRFDCRPEFLTETRECNLHVLRSFKQIV